MGHFPSLTCSTVSFKWMITEALNRQDQPGFRVILKVGKELDCERAQFTEVWIMTKGTVSFYLQLCTILQASAICGYLNLNLNQLELNTIKILVPSLHQPHFKFSLWLAASILSSASTGHFHGYRNFYWMMLIYSHLTN